MKYILIPSIFLVASEFFYRCIFDIDPIAKLWEEWLYIAVFLSLLAYSRWTAVKILIIFFFLLSFLANNIHYAVYQSWINGVNYYLAVAEWSEVVNTGITIVPKLLPVIAWSLFNFSIVFFVFKKTKHELVPYPVADFAFILIFSFISVRSFLHNSRAWNFPKS